MSASASVRASYGVNSSFGGFSADLGTATLANGVYTGAGAFAVAIADGATTPWMVRAGDILTFSLGLEVGAASGCGSFGCPPDSDALGSSLNGTAGFAPGGLVAVLPPGWSNNSEGGGIVDNIFVGFDGSGSDVPEPAPLSLFAFGLMTLGAVGCRRRRV